MMVASRGTFLPIDRGKTTRHKQDHQCASKRYCGSLDVASIGQEF
jgi:hypothetical protein